MPTFKRAVASHLDYAVGVNSQMILAVTHATGPSNDARHLAGLKRRASRSDERGHPAWVMLADSGFDSAKIGPRDIIPPIRRGGNLKAAQRKARAKLVSHARLDGLFGQRWKNETVNSVIKRKFGDAVRSVKRAGQNRESRLKGFHLQRASLTTSPSGWVFNRAISAHCRLSRRGRPPPNRCAFT